MHHGTSELTGSSTADGLALAIRLTLLLCTVVVAGAGLLRPLGGDPPGRVRATLGAVGAASAVLALVSVAALDVNVVGGAVHAVLSVAVVVTLTRPRVTVGPSGALLVLLVVETGAGRSGLDLMLDLVVVTAAATWFGVVVAMASGTWLGRTVRPGGLMTSLGVVLAVAGALALVWSGLGPDRRLLTTGIGVVSLAAVVLPVAATVLVVAARRWSGPRGATGLAAAGVAVAFVAWTAAPALGRPAELPVPGVPVLASATVGGADVPVLISPHRPGTNLVHLPASAGDDVTVGVDGDGFVPAGGRRGAPGRWAEVQLPEGRSEIVVRAGGDEAGIDVDTGSGAGSGPPGATGADGPECATAALGGLVGGARDVLRRCPAEALSDRDERSLRSLVGHLAQREVPAVALAADDSPRSRLAARVVRLEAQRHGLPVRTGPVRDAALIVVSGWTDAHTTVQRTAQDQTRGPTYLYGVHLAPWLLTSPVVNSLATTSLALDMDPRGPNAVEFVVALGGRFGGQRPTLDGYRRWLAAQGRSDAEQNRIYASAQVTAMPMGAGEPHAPGMSGIGDGAGNWIEGAAVVPVTGPLRP